MSTTFDVSAIAQEMKLAQDQVLQLETLTSRYSDFSLSAAYEVANLMHQARCAEGATPVGRKIGFTNSDMWTLYHVREPIWAHVYNTTVVHSPSGHSSCSLGRFSEPKIEPEVVLHFRSTPPADGSVDAMLDSIDWIAIGFEVVQSHFPGWRFQAADTVADGSLHGQLFVGKPQPIASMGNALAEQLAAFTVELCCDGTVRETGRGSNVLGSPLVAVAHLIHVLGGQMASAPLQAGEIVTTGTLTKARTVHAGETWSTMVDGISLPAFSLEFTP